MQPVTSVKGSLTVGILLWACPQTQPGISLAMYWAAGKVLEGVEKKRGSLKSLAFSLPGGNGKKIYALAAETLKS